MNAKPAASRSPTPRPAQRARRHLPCDIHRYAVKIAVGVSAVNCEFTQNIVAPGAYFAAINVNNPSNRHAVDFRRGPLTFGANLNGTPTAVYMNGGFRSAARHDR